ncbi:MAG: 50S ribosomal protein L5 [Candidatus Jorgensenbacteria bacterium]|nr:50S ribosomal protein L5 [Candidatus Jorgensenbacteria bacterium]
MKEITKQQYTARRFLEKIVVNVGLGRLKGQANFEEKVLPEIAKEIAVISGQKPANRVAKKSIAGFGTREGDIIGLQVTIRRSRMDDFLKKLVAVVIPRVKDFRGLELSNVDTNGNLNIGFHDQYVFPEINMEKSRIPFGLQVTCVPKVRNRVKAIDFYRSIRVPLKK